MEAPRRAVAREVDRPDPGPGEVLIEVRRCGVCGTDLHIFAGDFLSPYPLIPGHEFAGVVADVGPGTARVQKGMRVAVDPSLFCGKCSYCLTDRGNQCERWGAIGDTVNGAMAQYVCVPEENVYELPFDMTFTQAAFIEPVACVVHAVNRLAPRAGQSVLLFGAGSMGQLLVQALAQSGAGELAVIDVAENKLELARKHGATSTYLAAQTPDLLARRKGRGGFDVVVDVTGLPAVIQTQFAYLAPGGTHLQFGVAPPDAAIAVSPFDIYHNDWRLIGSMAINHTFKPAMDWIAAGRFSVDPLVSEVLELSQLPEFFENGKAADVMKVQIELA